MNKLEKHKLERYRFECTHPKCSDTITIEVKGGNEIYGTMRETEWYSDPNVVYGFICPKHAGDLK